MHGTPNQYGPPPPRPPHARPPLPGPPSPRRQRSNRQGWLIAGVALAALLVLGGIATAVTPDDSGNGEPAAAAPSVPAYTVVKTHAKGLSTDITVEVDAMPPDGGLRRVFNDVRKKHHKDGGYFVIINCATGATKAADNRLANGRYAEGREGEAATGLDDGKAEFEVLPDAECPAR